MGLAEGEAVRVDSSRGSLVLPGVGAIRTCRPGSVVVPWNLPGAHAGDLIDARPPFTEVTVRPAAGGGWCDHG